MRISVLCYAKREIIALRHVVWGLGASQVLCSERGCMICAHMHAFIRLIRMRSFENSDFMHSRAPCEALGVALVPQMIHLCAYACLGIHLML